MSCTHHRRTIIYVPKILIVGIFVGNQVRQHLGLYSEFLDSYLDDLMCIPIVFYLLQCVQIFIFRDKYVASPLHIIGAVIVFTLMFEIILPNISSRYTADIYDVVFYSIGGLFYITIESFINRYTL